MLTVLTPEDTVSILNGNLVFGGNAKSLLDQENNLILGGNLFDGSNATSLLEQENNVINSGNILDGNTNNADSIKGDSQNNQLTGLAGDDLIDGRGGNDVIDGGLGNDTLIGGAGDDTFNGSQGDDSIDGGDGIDTADYSELGVGITLSGVGTITKADGFGTDQIFKIETVIADASVANNTIDASESLAGVSITADLEAESISANNVPQLGTLTFNVLNFVNVIGTNESDIIAGDDQNNQLFGNDGDDIFKGSQGDDSIDGGDGIDTADYSELGVGITLSGVGTITKADGFGTDQIFKIETVIADASVANNTIDASESLAGVSITADLEAESISANNVPQLGTLTFNVLNFVNVIGTNESDIIAGDDQNNQLFGNDGDDSIIGGEGNDVLTGGIGADNFTFNSTNEGVDIIKDYNFVEGDVIQVSKVGFGTTNSSDFSYNASTGNLSFLGNQLAFVENLSPNVNIQLV
ncbi:calcium-binding protein [Nostoc sp. XA010]|uniref:calcium-binding protein n=1 Tax=Nostoc sp. XA010 TaxID=2780407 RepID=UPI001E3E0987|nr:calcium-binding protein [Nostoc sp. XA010]MCC5656783.1 calcium-binding protein [Nostoc sp. XA010]